MAGGKSTVYSNNFLTWALTTAAAPTRPSSWSIALYSDATNIAGAPSTELVAASCPGYSRQSASFGASAATGGQISNTTDTAFTATGGPWITANWYGILDGSGTMIYYAALSAPRTLQVSGDKIDFAIGSIVASEK